MVAEIFKIIWNDSKVFNFYFSFKHIMRYSYAQIKDKLLLFDKKKFKIIFMYSSSSSALAQP